jgi:small redox-active disulfide protein 2
MDIKVLGSGCRNCMLLEHRTQDALDSLGQTATIAKVTDFAAIAGYGVMQTPALVVDGRVVVTGQVPTARRLATLIAG